jgi:hypothetical protein
MRGWLNWRRRGESAPDARTVDGSAIPVRRCELCGAGMSESVRADVEAPRRYKLVYLDPDRSWFVYDACDDRWQRHLDVQPVLERERERSRERLTVQVRAWLEGAPVGPEKFWGGDEVLGWEEAVQQCVGSLEFGMRCVVHFRSVQRAAARRVQQCPMPVDSHGGDGG